MATPYIFTTAGSPCDEVARRLTFEVDKLNGDIAALSGILDKAEPILCPVKKLDKEAEYCEEMEPETQEECEAAGGVWDAMNSVCICNPVCTGSETSQALCEAVGGQWIGGKCVCPVPQPPKFCTGNEEDQAECETVGGQWIGGECICPTGEALAKTRQNMKDAVAAIRQHVLPYLAPKEDEVYDPDAPKPEGICLDTAKQNVSALISNPFGLVGPSMKDALDSTAGLDSIFATLTLTHMEALLDIDSVAGGMDGRAKDLCAIADCNCDDPGMVSEKKTHFTDACKTVGFAATLPDDGVCVAIIDEALHCDAVNSNPLTPSTYINPVNVESLCVVTKFIVALLPDIEDVKVELEEVLFYLNNPYEVPLTPYIPPSAVCCPPEGCDV